MTSNLMDMCLLQEDSLP